MDDDLLVDFSNISLDLKCLSCKYFYKIKDSDFCSECALLIQFKDMPFDELCKLDPNKIKGPIVNVHLENFFNLYKKSVKSPFTILHKQDEFNMLLNICKDATDG